VTEKKGERIERKRRNKNNLCGFDRCKQENAKTKWGRDEEELAKARWGI